MIFSGHPPTTNGQELLKVLGAPLRKMPLGSAEMANSAWVKAGIRAEYIEAR